MRPGHIALLLIIGAFTLWFVADVVGVTTRLTNTILVVPLGALVIAAVLWELGVETVLRPRRTAPTAAVASERVAVLRGMALLSLTAALAALYERIGLDIAAMLFLFGALLLLDTRQWLAKALFAALFGGLVAGGAAWLLPYPLPTALF